MTNFKTLQELGVSPTELRNGKGSFICPECSHTRKPKNQKVKCMSISIEPNRKVYNCSHCGFGGVVSDEEEYKMEKEYSKPVEVSVNVPEQVLSWFEGRGLKKETVAYFKITTDTKFMPQVGDNRGVIAFPYYFNGEITNYKYRDKDKNFMMVSGAQKTLFNIDNIDSDIPDLVFVEGEIDLMSIHQSGVSQGVSVPNGATTGNVNLDYIDPHYETIKKKKRIIIATDNDEAGINLRDAIAERFGKDICVYVDFGDCKDANEFLVKYGEDALRKRITKEFKQFPISGIYDLEENKDKIVNRRIEDHRNYSMGWQHGDEHFKVALGEWTIVTGAPNSGKSELVESILIQMTKKGFKCAMFIPESMPVEEHYERLVMKILETSNPTPNDKLSIWETIKDHFIWVEEDLTKVNLDTLLSIFKQVSIQHGVKFFYIDPFNFLEDAYDYKQLGQSLTKMTQFVKNHNVHMFVVAHPKKPQRNKDGSYPKFTLYDVSGTADWYNKTYNGIVVQRNYSEKSPVNTDMVDVYVEKVKRRLNGSAGGSFRVYPDFNRGGVLLDDVVKSDQEPDDPFLTME